MPFHEFKYVYSKVSRLCVGVVIIESGELLLAKRAIPPFQGKWHFPGGTVLMGESLRSAVVRVAKSEIGIGVNVESIMGVIEFSETEFGQAVSVPFFCFSC